MMSADYRIELDKSTAAREIERQVIGKIIMASTATLNYNKLSVHTLCTHERTYTRIGHIGQRIWNTEKEYTK